jgi:copper chaperone CopZ
LTVIALSAAQVFAGNVEVKGPHICCKQCVNVVGKLLEKVEGVSDVVADVKTKTITFKAKDAAAAKAGYKAIVDGGFFGAATDDGKAITLDVAAGSKDKADAISVKDVHVCCGMCVTAVKGIFKDAKVTIEGTGAQRTVNISGGGHSPNSVLEALRKGGFNGTVAK